MRKHRTVRRERLLEVVGAAKVGPLVVIVVVGVVRLRRDAGTALVEGGRSRFRDRGVVMACPRVCLTMRTTLVGRLLMTVPQGEVAIVVD